MATADLEFQLESVLARSLPEAFSSWKQGHAPQQVVAESFEAALASWDELVSRADQVEWEDVTPGV